LRSLDLKVFCELADSARTARKAQTAPQLGDEYIRHLRRFDACASHFLTASHLNLSLIILGLQFPWPFALWWTDRHPPCALLVAAAEDSTPPWVLNRRPCAVVAVEDSTLL